MSRTVRWLAALALLSGLACAVHGYRANAASFFHGGLLLAAAALAPLSLQAIRRGWGGAVLVANTAICLFLALVVLEVFWSLLGQRDMEPETFPVYVYRDPDSMSAEALRRQRKTMAQNFKRSQLPMVMPDPRRLNPFVLKPGTYSIPNGSTVQINALGFRGREIRREKGNHYRVIALGESTTYGLTFGPDERPWPEVLESLIQREFDCDLPVQVINAGVPGWNLQNQLSRLAHDILPLEPDLVLTYHGYNGFHLILEVLPPTLVEKAPAPTPRPSRLLEGAEAAVRLWWFRRRYDAARRLTDAVLESDVSATRFATLYRQLASATRDRGIKLALCTFNLAVNQSSPDGPIRFYEAVFPDVRARILANHLHSRLVRDMGRGADVLAVDTSRELDGAYRDAYRDLLHYNQLGRDRLARNILDGLRDHLQMEPRLKCRPRGR